MNKKIKTKILLVKSFFVKNPLFFYFLLGALFVLIFPLALKYVALTFLALLGYDKTSKISIAKKIHEKTLVKDKQVIEDLRKDILNQQEKIKEPITTSHIENEELDALEQNFLFSKKDPRDD